MALSKTELLNKVLVAIIIFLLIVIVTGTLIVKLSPPKAPAAPGELIAQGKAVNLAAPADTSDIAYFELGTLRITTLNKDEDNMLGIGMVLSPWLAYPAGDSVFYEELMRKKGVLKAVFQHYFSDQTKDQILSQSEESISSTLLAQVNEKLSLGKVSDIYFTDYLFLE
ncbi:MAG: flagellar basal body-associated FliL family protein [Treponema sp.]|nr:flagellar basal body-associated FliL family protein [Treponema sp.]